MSGKWIEIFRAGTHTDMHGRKLVFTRSQLQAVVDAYDPTQHEAPVVIGHPTTNLPAYAWVQALRMDGDVMLYLERLADPEFTAARKAGRFKKRSASFFLPNAPGNPTPGQLALRHVGWLGAAAPAVKGLRDVEFSAKALSVVEFHEPVAVRDSAETVGLVAKIMSHVRGRMAEEHGDDAAERIVPQAEVDALIDAGLVPGKRAKAPAAPTRAGAATPAQGAAGAAQFQEGERGITVRERAAQPPQPAPQRDLQPAFPARPAVPASAVASDKDAELEARARALDARERELSIGKAMSFADEMVAGGKIGKDQRANFAALLVHLDHSPISFSDVDGDAHQLGDSLRSIVRGFGR